MVKQRLRAGIQFKFLGMMFGVLIVMSIALSILNARNERTLLKQSLLGKGQSLASYMAKLSTDALLMKDYIYLDVISKEVNNDPEVAYATIQDKEGQPLTSPFASVNYRVPGL